jgi:type IV pilus assembly protein PilV
MRAKSHSEGGFTLVETLVAMTLFAVGILALAQIQFAAARSSSTAKVTSTASFLASDRLEELVYGSDFDGITPDNFPDEDYGQVSGGDSRYGNYARAVVIEDSTDVAGRVALKTVTVTVTWHAMHGDRNVTLRSRVARF